MKRLLSRTGLFTGTLLVQALPALANAPEGEGAPDYSGITGMYYTLIASDPRVRRLRHVFQEVVRNRASLTRLM